MELVLGRKWHILYIYTYFARIWSRNRGQTASLHLLFAPRRQTIRKNLIRHILQLCGLNRLLKLLGHLLWLVVGRIRHWLHNLIYRLIPRCKSIVSILSVLRQGCVHCHGGLTSFVEVEGTITWVYIRTLIICVLSLL